MTGSFVKRLEEMPGVHVREQQGVLVAEPISDHDVQRVVTALKGADRKIHLSLNRMDQLGRFDEESFSVSVSAGAMLVALEEAANRVGMSVGPLSPGAMALSVGAFLEGPYAGLRAVPCGRLEPISTSLRVVTPDALVTESRVSPRSAAGPDLDALHLGGERKFGIIVGARLRLLPRFNAHQRAVFSFPTAGGLIGTVLSSLQDGVTFASAAMERRADRFVVTLQLRGSTEMVERDLATVGRRAVKEHGRAASPSQATEARATESVEAFADWEQVRDALEHGRAILAWRLSVAGAVVRAVGVGTPLVRGSTSPMAEAIAATVDPDGVLKGLL